MEYWNLAGGRQEVLLQVLSVGGFEVPNVTSFLPDTALMQRPPTPINANTRQGHAKVPAQFWHILNVLAEVRGRQWRGITRLCRGGPLERGKGHGERALIS